MLYRVGELAKMLGMSLSALRFFEDRGLICPIRNEENGYRLYEPIDLNRFLRIKTYARCGFTLEEIAQMLQMEDLAQLGAAYRGKADELEAEIAWKQRCLAYMRDMEAEFTFARAQIGRWILRERPEMDCFVFRTQEEIAREKACHDLIRRWTQLKPLTQSLMLLDAGGMAQKRAQMSYGMLIETRYTQGEEIEKSGFVTHYPAHAPCAYTVYERKTGEPEQTFSCLLRTLEEAQAQGYALCGDVIGRVLHTGAASNQALYHITEFWIPLNKA